MKGIAEVRVPASSSSGQTLQLHGDSANAYVHTSQYYEYDKQESQSHFSITLLMFTGLLAFILWAALFEIDQAVRAQGQVIPSARTQIIQAADGGVLAQLLVHEGQTVEAGQRLAVLEKERVNATFEESRAKVAALTAALVRAKAESVRKAPVFPAELNDYPDFVTVERNLYTQRRRGLQDELHTLQSGLDMSLEELRMSEALFKTGDTSRIEVLRAKRLVSEHRGKISAARNKYLQEARKEITKLEADLASARHQLEERRNVLHHKELITPVAGIVKYLKVNTVGGVLGSGDELMQISPTESDMLIEVKINPADIGQLSLGLPVSIKLDAFDFSIFGTLHGTLDYISSDTLTEQSSDGQSNTYYRARIRLDAEAGKHNPKLAHVDLKPGMTALVDVKTDSRTVLQYLAKPIYRAFGGAMTER
ncbi:MAG: HlyD family efflux transporter periplasmic adaptor subunit [Candidatus Sedimenticola sp. 20ELBAFRAG]